MRRITLLLAVLWLAAIPVGGVPPELSAQPGDGMDPQPPSAVVDPALGAAEAGIPSGRPTTGFQSVLPETQLVPFLGTATTQAAPSERAPLGLPDGVGLTVQHVLRDSPAAVAGIHRYDVLHKLGDQILVNDPQFRTLLRMHNPGDRVEIHALRQGRPVTFTVELGRREVPIGEVAAAEMLRWLLQPAPEVDPVSELAGFSARYEDAQYVLVLSTDPRGKHLLAKDKEGNVLFEGEVGTPQQRAAVPEPLLPKLERLERPPQPQSAPAGEDEP